METVEQQTAAHPQASIIWLHGLGADGHDFEPIVPQLTWPQQPALRFVFPHAPLRPITINGGMTMRAWYDVRGTSLAERQDEAGIRSSAELIEGLIAREQERGIAPEQIALAGFSQGGAMALFTGLKHAQKLAGIVALSCYLPLDQQLAQERKPANQDTPIWMAHGSVDMVVPPKLGEQSAQQLRAWGYSLSWQTYPMAHAVCAEQIEDLRHWLQSRLVT